MKDLLCSHEIMKHMHSDAKLYIHASLESTNDTAKVLPGAEHGTTIIADTQSAGRGRNGRKFFSPQGCGIYMSVVLLPAQLWHGTTKGGVLECGPGLVTPGAAVAVCEAIETIISSSRKKKCPTQQAGQPYEESIAPQIKWVNDILIDGKKVCGILTEAVADAAGMIKRIIVGIGINFTLPPGGYPAELAESVGAVADLKINCYTRNRLIAEVHNRLMANLNTAHKIIPAYKKRLLMLRRRISVICPEGTYEATPLDVDSNGGLVVEKDCGEILTLTSGEISIRF